MIWRASVPELPIDTRTLFPDRCIYSVAISSSAVEALAADSTRMRCDSRAREEVAWAPKPRIMADKAAIDFDLVTFFSGPRERRVILCVPILDSGTSYRYVHRPFSLIFYSLPA